MLSFKPLQGNTFSDSQRSSISDEMGRKRNHLPVMCRFTAAHKHTMFAVLLFLYLDDL